MPELPLNWNMPEWGEAVNPHGSGVGAVVQSGSLTLLRASASARASTLDSLAPLSDDRTRQEDGERGIEALSILRANTTKETSCPIKSFSRELTCVSSSI